MLDGLVDASYAPTDPRTDPRMALQWLESSLTSQLSTAACVSQGRHLVIVCKLGFVFSARVRPGKRRLALHDVSLDEASVRCSRGCWDV